MIHLSGLTDWPVELPEVDDVPCCAGTAYRGPESCMCWKPVYDVDQVPLDRCHQDAPDVTQPAMCADCAFKPASPERSGDDRYENAGDLDRVAAGDTPFRCHQGVRRLVAIVHPSGARVEIPTDHYAPPQTWRAYQANGEPALVCAGWAARKATT